jgi:hypothetical protein
METCSRKAQNDRMARSIHDTMLDKGKFTALRLRRLGIRA